MASGKRDNEARDHGLGEQNEEVDATVLQCQNQKLVQQLEAQKAEVHKLEAKIKELRDKQNFYDLILMSVNKKWNQLVDDLVLFGLRAGGDLKYLQELDHEDYSTDASYPPEETFLFRILQVEPAKRDLQNGMMKFVQEALASRHLITLDLMKQLQETISARRTTNECLTMALHGNLSFEGSIVQLKKLDESLKEVVYNMHQAVDVLNQKHQKYTDDIRQCMDNHSVEQLEIKRLSGELEESLAELEESRRKLAILQMQKHGVAAAHSSVTNTVNGNKSPDKFSDRSICLKDMKESIEEAQTLAESRLLELKSAQEDISILSKQLEAAENQLKDENFVTSSKLYILTKEKLQRLNMELARYKGLIESLQADRNNNLKKEKELSTKADLVNTAFVSIDKFDSKIADLDIQIQKNIAEKNELEIKCEEVEQDLERKDIKNEIHVMASALSKELEMMETQTNRSKSAASESNSLREEAISLKALVEEKIKERKILSDRYAEQMVETKYLKSLIEELQKENEELEFFLDMHGQECHGSRTIMEIKESEHKAKAQAELLKAALDEHSLELRVKAAYDSEATYQERISTCEAEIPDLKDKLKTSEGDVMELKEAIRIKDSEAEAYISEIETIGQAYEDMQTQNQHLLQQVADRDAYNIKLVSDSVKLKQNHSSLLLEKQSMLKRLQQVNGSLEFFKGKVSSNESQMKALVAKAIKSSSENRNLNINLEKTKLELVGSEKELKWLRSTVSSSEKEYEQNQRKIAELRIELERERNERRKLEEELEEVQSEVMELSPESEEASIRKLQEEINECKAILKCGVCFDRPKEVVITKCFHLFCYPCIHRNLEIRHRKCPGCGTPFGQNDVREVKI